ncbi:MAG: hypothetical protein HKN13_11515, partial [Rhodothermales bacterium]|nr:hypothetical protein [Rhodothermales bacterium]
AEYDFPPYPEVFTGAYFPGHPKRPIHAIIRLGSRLIKEVEAAEIRDKLDSAVTMVNVGEEVGDRLLIRANRYLRTVPPDDNEDVDFLLEISILDYGIDAEDWDAAARFFVDAEVALLDGYDGREIWSTRVRERDNIVPAIFGPTSVRNVITAHAFAELSVEEIVAALDQLSIYCADHIAERLRNDLRDARD